MGGRAAYAGLLNPISGLAMLGDRGFRWAILMRDSVSLNESAFALTGLPRVAVVVGRPKMSLMVGTVISFGAMWENAVKLSPEDPWFILGSVTVADWVVDIVRYSQCGMVWVWYDQWL